MLFRYLMIAVISLCVVGCGGSQPGRKTAPVNVTGKLSQAGQPVGKVAVTFQPLDHGHMINLTVKADGTFQGEMIPGKYAYTIVPGQSSTKVDPRFIEADLQRTVDVEAGKPMLIALD